MKPRCPEIIRFLSVIAPVLGATVAALAIDVSAAGSDEGPLDSYLTEAKKRSLARVQEYLFNDKYDSAHYALDIFVARAPDDPVGYVYRAAVYLNQMTDAEDDRHSHEFTVALEAIRSSAAMWPASSARDTAWMYLFQGHAHAYRALWESRFGSFTSALKQAFDARASYENGLEADSTLYDLYGGLGMYHYWKSARAGFLRWLGIFKNEKDKGIKELYLAAESSVISNDIARNALIWIWLDQEQYDSVIVICRQRLTVFPEGKLFLWPLAEAYYEKKEYALAAEAYARLRHRLLIDPGNYYNLVQCDYFLNQCYDKLDQKRQAILAARSVNGYYARIPDNVKRRLRNRVDFLRRVSKQEIR